MRKSSASDVRKAAQKDRASKHEPRTVGRLSRDWAVFGKSLTAALDALSPSQYLILTVHGRHRYVQFSQQGKWGVRTECVSNEYLKPDDRLSEVEESALESLGWTSPTLKPAGSGTVGDDVDGSPNWFAQFDKPVDYGALVDLTICTFTEVYGVTHPSTLRYKASDIAGTAILLPTFRVERERESEESQTEVPSLVERVAQAAEYGSDSGIEPLAANAFGVTVNGRGFVVVVEESRFLARILCPLCPATEFTDGLLEGVNQMNAEQVPFGHVYVRDGEVRYAAEVIVDPFCAEQIPVALGLAAEVVAGLYFGDEGG